MRHKIYEESPSRPRAVAPFGFGLLMKHQLTTKCAHPFRGVPEGGRRAQTKGEVARN